MRGSLISVQVRCGQAGCECAQGGPGHPKTHLTVNIGGKTRTLYVNRNRHDEIAAMLDSYRRVWAIINELTEINLALLRGERSAPARRKPRTLRSR